MVKAFVAKHLGLFLPVCKNLNLCFHQVLKGGQEAPTKPKGRPKKNSIPTSEEIEAEERLHRLAEDTQMKAEDNGNQVQEAEEGDKTVEENEQEETQNPETPSPPLPCTSIESPPNERESSR